MPESVWAYMRDWACKLLPVNAPDADPARFARIVSSPNTLAGIDVDDPGQHGQVNWIETATAQCSARPDKRADGRRGLARPLCEL